MGIQNERDRKTILDLRNGSSVTFEGSASIGAGARIYTKGKLVIGDNFYLSLNSQIIAHESIAFGKDCTVGWDSLIMDTDFHRVIDLSTGMTYPMTKPINIGDHCWICNNVQVLKGTKLPDDVIVGSCSLLNKVYEIPSHSLLAGNPAKVRKTDITHER
ncbi:MAG: acyltransferase [Muribaculaceae bacterium]|nr:acyltransferase [Muribaculaceae bacterium]